MKNLNQNAFVVAASENYLESLIALINSISIYHNDSVDIVLVSFNLPQEFLDKLKGKKHIRIFPVEGNNQTHMTAIERFNIASQIGKEYESICLLDCDMFLTHDVNIFFDISSKNFIVTGSNGMIIDFNAEHQKRYNIDLGTPNYLYGKVHTTVPVFLSPNDLDWFEELYNSRRVDSWDDFLYFNMIGIKMKKYERMLVMPPYTFTGIHHFQMKVETGLMRKGNVLLTGTEEEVYMVHGKWWWKGWLQDLMPTMEKYLKDEGMSGKARYRVENSIKTIKEEFQKYYNDGKII